MIERAQTDPADPSPGHGKPSAVVVSAEEWGAARPSAKAPSPEFLLASPLRAHDLRSRRAHSVTSRATSIYEDILIDTNVLSEVRRPWRRSRRCWPGSTGSTRTGPLSARRLDCGASWRGIALMEEGRRRAALSAWLYADVDLPARASPAASLCLIDHCGRRTLGRSVCAQAPQRAASRSQRWTGSSPRPRSRTAWCSPPATSRILRRSAYQGSIHGSAGPSRNDCSCLEALRRPW